jgi:hypothetical protein
VPGHHTTLAPRRRTTVVLWHINNLIHSAPAPAPPRANPSAPTTPGCPHPAVPYKTQQYPTHFRESVPASPKLSGNPPRPAKTRHFFANPCLNYQMWWQHPKEAKTTGHLPDKSGHLPDKKRTNLPHVSAPKQPLQARKAPPTGQNRTHFTIWKIQSLKTPQNPAYFTNLMAA